MWANRNGLFYVLDRTTGQFLLGKPFVEVNWMNGFDEKGRPDAGAGQSADAGRNADQSRQPGRNELVFAFVQPAHRTVLHSRRGEYSSVYVKQPVEYTEGTTLCGRDAAVAGARWSDPVRSIRRRDDEGYGAVRAIDPNTGERKWEFKMADVTDSGILTTAIGSAVCGRPRRLLLCTGCAQRFDVVEGEYGRPDLVGSDDLRGGRKTICCRGVGQFAFCIRAAGSPR